MENNINQELIVKEKKTSSGFFKTFLYILLTIMLLAGTFYAGIYFSDNFEEKEEIEIEKEIKEIIEEERNISKISLRNPEDFNIRQTTQEDRIEFCEITVPNLISYYDSENELIISQKKLIEDEQLFQEYLKAEKIINENNTLKDEITYISNIFTTHCSGNNYEYLDDLNNISITNINNIGAIYWGNWAGAGVIETLEDIHMSIIIYLATNENIAKMSYQFNAGDIFEQSEGEQCNYDTDCLTEIYDTKRNKVEKKVQELISTFEIY